MSDERRDASPQIDCRTALAAVGGNDAHLERLGEGQGRSLFADRLLGEVEFVLTGTLRIQRDRGAGDGDFGAGRSADLDRSGWRVVPEMVEDCSCAEGDGYLEFELGCGSVRLHYGERQAVLTDRERCVRLHHGFAVFELYGALAERNRRAVGAVRAPHHDFIAGCADAQPFDFDMRCAVRPERENERADRDGSEPTHQSEEGTATSRRGWWTGHLGGGWRCLIELGRGRGAAGGSHAWASDAE